jgi:hypothetical protein
MIQPSKEWVYTGIELLTTRKLGLAAVGAGGEGLLFPGIWVVV